MSTPERFTTTIDNDPFIAYDILATKEFIFEKDTEPTVIDWTLYGVDTWGARHAIASDATYSAVAGRYTRITGLPVSLTEEERTRLPSLIEGEFVK